LAVVARLELDSDEVHRRIPGFVVPLRDQGFQGRALKKGLPGDLEPLVEVVKHGKFRRFASLF
jgi:hypothetical protein